MGDWARVRRRCNLRICSRTRFSCARRSASPAMTSPSRSRSRPNSTSSADTVRTPPRLATVRRTPTLLLLLLAQPSAPPPLLMPSQSVPSSKQGPRAPQFSVLMQLPPLFWARGSGKGSRGRGSRCALQLRNASWRTRGSLSNSSSTLVFFAPLLLPSPLLPLTTCDPLAAFGREALAAGAVAAGTVAVGAVAVAVGTPGTLRATEIVRAVG
mmetsp:Transcript_3113/g.7221  ORF Transcript_3113/g.7221 Transcript_3113/m.7221 type:complete len:212 (-) Transcript_3113:1202-1837(-)